MSIQTHLFQSPALLPIDLVKDEMDIFSQMEFGNLMLEKTDQKLTR